MVNLTVSQGIVFGLGGYCGQNQFLPAAFNENPGEVIHVQALHGHDDHAGRGERRALSRRKFASGTLTLRDKAVNADDRRK
jgi:hypothetical protein